MIIETQSETFTAKSVAKRKQNRLLDEIQRKFGYQLVSAEFVLNKKGNHIVQTAWAVKDGKWFHIDNLGRPLYEERYDEVFHLRNGVAKVNKSGEYFVIGLSGERIG